jgi:hypothetical protein
LGGGNVAAVDVRHQEVVPPVGGKHQRQDVPAVMVLQRMVMVLFRLNRVNSSTVLASE